MIGDLSTSANLACASPGMFSDGLWIIVLEMLFALGVAVFIVWWTLPRRKAAPPDKSDRQPPGAAGR